MLAERKSDKYESDPVYYCSKCYSLNIQHEDSIDEDCCMDCGCIDIKESDINTWEKMYERRYGRKYMSRGTDIHKHPIFLLSLKKLKVCVYGMSSWLMLARTLYNDFPLGLNKMESIMLLFDKLVHDNRIDDLRTLLVDYDRRGKL